MNTTFEDFTNLKEMSSLVTVVFGTALCLPNTFVFIALVKLVVSFMKSRDNYLKTSDRYTMMSQLLFVCMNDTISGYVVLAIGLVRVSNQLSAYVCAVSLFFSPSLQMISNGTLTFICAQRYLAARHIRKKGTKTKSRYALILIALNSSTAVVTMGILLGSTKIKQIERGYTNHCTYEDFVTKNVAIFGIVFYVIGILFLVTANVFCVMTVKRLKSELSAVVSPSECMVSNTNTNMSTVTEDDQTRKSLKLRQKKAVFSIMLIVLSFNSSYVPALISYFLFFTFNVKLNELAMRVLYLTLFINSLINPFIIATRIEEIRLVIKKTAGSFKRLFC